MNSGMLIAVGQAVMQGASWQYKQREASARACGSVSPGFKSSNASSRRRVGSFGMVNPLGSAKGRDRSKRRLDIIRHAMAKPPDDAKKTITKNRKAFHDFTILEQVEAGIVLTGTEVKSLRDGHVILEESFARVADGQAVLLSVT